MMSGIVSTKNIGVLLLIGVILMFGLTACQSPITKASEVGRFVSGYVPTASELAQLEALVPQAAALEAQYTSPDGKVDRAGLAVEYNNLLKKQFGDDWKKFAVVRTATSIVNAETNDQVAEGKTTFVDPETGASLGNDGRAADSTNQDIGNGYFAFCEAWQSSWFWATWNSARTTFRVHTVGWFGPSSADVTATSIETDLQDAATNPKAQHMLANVSSADVSGNSLGWWKSVFSFDAWYIITSPNIPGGRFSYTKHWF